MGSIILKGPGPMLAAALLAGALLAGAPALGAADEQSGGPGGAGEGAVTVLSSDPGSRHSYRAYRLVSCEVGEDGSIKDPSTKGCMSDVFWVQLGTSDYWDGEAELVEANAQDVAVWLSKRITADAADFVQTMASLAVRTCGEGAYVAFDSGEQEFLESGYYLIVGEDNIPMCLAVGGSPRTVQEKASVPTLDKEVGQVGSGGATSWGSYATGGVGQDIPYRLTASVVSNYNQFSSYGMRFVDDMEDSLRVEDLSSVRVRVLDEAGGTVSDITSVAEASFADGRLEVYIADLKAAYPSADPGDVVVVDYNARLVPDRVDIGALDPNDNEAYLEYSKNPAFDAWGKTVPDDAHLYSFMVRLYKLDEGSKSSLAGAQFALQDGAGRYLRNDGEWVAQRTDACVYTTDERGSFACAGLGAGSYTLTELEAPAGYAGLAAPVVVSLGADLDREQGVVSLSASVANPEARIVSVDANGGVLEVSVANSRLPVQTLPPSGFTTTATTTLPQLGGGVAAIAALAGSAALGALGVALLARSRRKGKADSQEGHDAERSGLRE